MSGRRACMFHDNSFRTQWVVQGMVIVMNDVLSFIENINVNYDCTYWERMCV